MLKETENTKVIELFTREIKTDKVNFKVFTTLINGVFYKVKFKKDCETCNKLPIGYSRISVLIKDISREKSIDVVNKKGETVKSNPIIWIENFTEFEALTDEELASKKSLLIKDIFG